MPGLNARRSFFERFKLALQGSWGELYATVPKSCPEIPLEQMLQNVMTFSDAFWDSRYAFSKDPLGYLVNAQDADFLAHKSRNCGIAMVKKIRMEFGPLRIQELAQRMNLTVEKKQNAMHSGNIHFAEFIEPDTIYIYEDCLEKLSTLKEQIPENMKLMFQLVEEALLAHEIFHYLEFREKNIIFTRSYVYSLPPVLFFHRTVKFICLGEIAAAAFVKEYLNLPFSPCIYDLLLTYGYNRVAVNRLYNRIISLY